MLNVVLSTMLLANGKKTILKHHMLEPGDRVVVAVSGGPDSVCLLSVLRELAPEWDLTLHIAHLDHMFRGKESAAEADFVRGLADRLGIPASIERHDVPRFCRERGLSPQAGAREARYGFLDRVATAIGARKIALGHTASDQAETFLLRLLRGAGASGLSGIPPKREKYIRPLIYVRRNEVLDYLRERGFAFVTDPSNLRTDYTRNRIRLELMPLLRVFNPRIEQTLATEADLLRDEDEAMEDRIAEFIPRIILRKGETVRIERESFNAQLPAVRRRLLRTALAMLIEGNAPDLAAGQTDEAVAFIGEAQTGRAMDLPAGLRLLREYDAVTIGPPQTPRSFTIPLAVPGRTTVPGLLLEIETELLGPGASSGLAEIDENSRWQAVFDYDKIAAPLFVRSRRDGDRFQPAEMGGRSKKLQDYFTDKKVPRRKRDAVPLIATEENIVWIAGMRTDERFLVGPETKKTLVIHVRSAA